MFFVTTGALYGGGDWGYGTFIWQNLIPVIIGNTVGGGLFVGFVQWYLFYAAARPPVNTWDDASRTSSRYVASPVFDRKVRKDSDTEVPMESKVAIN